VWQDEESVMRRVIGWVGALAVVVLAADVRADDKKPEKPQPKAEKLSPDKLPPAIVSAIKGRFPKAEVTSAEKEVENGKVVFDIELKESGRKYEMDILEDGTIIEVEKEVFAQDVPAAITKAVKDKYPTAAVKEVMEVNKVMDKKETPDHYEVTIEVDGKKKEVEVSLDGKTVKEG
jgi:uncharacterized membrane protein YkoI